MSAWHIIVKHNQHHMRTHHTQRTQHTQHTQHPPIWYGQASRSRRRPPPIWYGQASRSRRRPPPQWYGLISIVSTPAGAGEISTTGQNVEIPYNYNGFRWFFFGFLWSRRRPEPARSRRPAKLSKYHYNYNGFRWFFWFSMVSTPAGAGEISTTGQIVEKPYNYNGFRAKKPPKPKPKTTGGAGGSSCRQTM